ncbi:metal-sensitive transcriptional regulator [Candidatus Poribacteria bacterium]
MIDQETKENTRRRLMSIKGQVQGIQQMIEDEKYCVDILIQLSAVKAALGKVGAIILKRHVESCVVDAIESGSEEKMAEKIEELVQVFSKYSG